MGKWLRGGAGADEAVRFCLEDDNLKQYARIRRELSVDADLRRHFTAGLRVQEQRVRGQDDWMVKHLGKEVRRSLQDLAASRRDLAHARQEMASVLLRGEG